jgi:hypothetical protein
MPISLFFTLLLALLLGMYSYFKPSVTLKESIKNAPLFEMDYFVIYEITPNKISSSFSGDYGAKFHDYYYATNAKLTSNKRELLESIRADRSVYKGDILNLKGNVTYVREDGLKFCFDEGIYNQKRSFAKTNGSFIITKNQHKVKGSQLYYDLTHDTVNASQITAIYQLN